MDDWDELLLEAMREVDAMLPDTPPIAPRRLSNEELRAAMQLANCQQQAALNNYEQHALQAQQNAYSRQMGGMGQLVGRNWN